jgi:hypothetical protein
VFCPLLHDSVALSIQVVFMGEKTFSIASTRRRNLGSERFWGFFSNDSILQQKDGQRRRFPPLSAAAMRRSWP